MRQAKLKLRGADRLLAKFDASASASATTASRSTEPGRKRKQKAIMNDDVSTEQLALAISGKVAVTAGMFTISMKGKDHEDKVRHHLTPRGMIVAAVRKCLCNVACADYGKVLMIDISKDSIVKSEIILGATRVAAFQRFHEYMEHKIAAAPATAVSRCTSPPTIAVHSFSPTPSWWPEQGGNQWVNLSESNQSVNEWMNESRIITWLD